jgi:hypothetical protein
VPVRDGERVHLRAELIREAYVYLLWADAEGKADVYYPWNRETDDLRVPPPPQAPRRVVESPPELDKGWAIEGAGGLETILLLARREPLPAGVKFDELLAGLPRAPLRDPREVAVLGFDGDRPLEPLHLFRGGSKTAKQIDDPLLRLLEKLRPHFEVIRAVRFAHQAGR